MHDREGGIKLAVFLNILLTFIEIIGGFLTNSLALLSDALHDFGDSITLVLSWVAERKAKKPADTARTFGYQRLSLLSSVFAALVLVAGSLFILSRAIPRLIKPEQVYPEGMILVALIGITVNGIGFLRLKKGISQNEKVLSWHLLEDMLGWVMIIVGGVIIKIFGLYIIDPIMTVGLASFILYGVGKNLKETFNIFMEGVPKHIDIEKLKKSVSSIKGVERIHDIHVWSLEGETDILVAHIVVGDKYFKNADKIKKKIKEELEKHHIEHSTIELESKKFCSGAECYFNKSKH